ncbi:MAG: hypothetical protein J0M08_00620 [Bacteroidetes bacterium]|nr:hypothetical protein [Bacteroidota bacterium]
MKSASLNDLKKELQVLQPKELIDLCISLAKYKRESKEYLDYLLFESTNKELFVSTVKTEIDEHFENLKQQENLYYVKKGLRKVLRILSKYSKFLNDKSHSADIHIYFCKSLKDSGIPYHKSALIVNLYAQQLKKINSLVDALHEDLQQDYIADLEKLKE